MLLPFGLNENKIEVDSNVFTTFLATDNFKSFTFESLIDSFASAPRQKPIYFHEILESQRLNLKDSDFNGETFWH